MSADPDRDRGILSKKDRQFLLDADEEEKKSSKGRVTRSRIRDRIYDGLLDFHLILEEVEARDRVRVFEHYSDDRDLQRGIDSAIKFLYIGLKELDQDFEEILTRSVESAERRFHQKKEDQDVEVDAEFNIETKLLLTDRDSEDFSDQEIGEMLTEGRIDGEEALDILKARLDSTDED